MLVFIAVFSILTQRRIWEEKMENIEELHSFDLYWNLLGYKILTRTPEEKRPLGKLRCCFDDNITMYVKEIGCDVSHWISFALNEMRGGLLWIW